MTAAPTEGSPPEKKTTIDVKLEARENLGDMTGVNFATATGPIEVNTATARFVIQQPAPRLGGYIPAPAVERYLPRGEVEKSVADRLRRQDGPALVAVVGMPGLGKSEFAKQIASQLKDDFQAVLWLELGAKSPQQVVSDLARQVGVALDASLGYGDQITEVKRSLSQVQVLVVLDDVRPQHTAHLRDYLPPSPPCAALLTSRLQQLGALPPAAIFSLQPLDETDSLLLLESILGEAVIAAERVAALALARRCAHNPLALDIAARRILQLSGLQPSGGICTHWFQPDRSGKYLEGRAYHGASGAGPPGEPLIAGFRRRQPRALAAARPAQRVCRQQAGSFR